MKPIYTEKQSGIWVVYLLLITIAIIAAYLFLGKHDVDRIIDLSLGSIVLILVTVAVSLLFYQLKVEVYNDRIALKFGIGFIKKTIPMSRIKEVRSVRNHWLMGWGIRFYGKGWMWNIRGLKAVELVFRDKKGTFRIGSQEPDILKSRIQDQLPQTH